MMDRREMLNASLIGSLASRILGLYPAAEIARAAKPPVAQIPDTLFGWTRQFLGFVLSCEPSPFHHWLAAELDGMRYNRGSKLSVLAPRGSAKSSWASFAYPLREAISGREPFTVIVSDTSAQAETFLRQIRTQLEENPALAEAYPKAFGRGPIWRDHHVQLRNGCEILAMGTGGKIRGRKSAANRRPTCVVADDVQNKDHIVSELQRGRSWDWFTQDLLSAGEPDTNFIVLGTALHRECVSCRLENTPGWTSRKWQAIVGWPARMDLWAEWRGMLVHAEGDEMAAGEEADEFFRKHEQAMTEGAEVLWPAREPLVDLMRHRATIGDNAFEAEKQNNPVSGELLEWPEEYFTHGAFWFDEWPSELTCRVIACDPSKGAHDKQGDYSAIVRYGRDRAGVEYVEADIKRRNVQTICADLARHQQEFRADGIAMETNGFQELLLIPLDQARRAINLDVLPVYKYDNTVPKSVRIRRLTAPLSQRRLRFKTRSPGTTELVKQLRDWPTGYMDGPDSLEMARRLAVELHNGKAQRR